MLSIKIYLLYKYTQGNFSFEIEAYYSQECKYKLFIADYTWWNMVPAQIKQSQMAWIQSGGVERTCSINFSNGEDLLALKGCILNHFTRAQTPISVTIGRYPTLFATR